LRTRGFEGQGNKLGLWFDVGKRWFNIPQLVLELGVLRA